MIGAMCRVFVAALLAIEAASFAVEELFTDQAMFDKLFTATLGEQKDTMANKLLLPAMQHLNHLITLEEGDLQVQQSFPDTYVENDGCHKTVQMLDTQAVGKFVQATVLNFTAGSPNLWQGAPVFAEAVFDAQLDVSTRVRLTLGRKIFHKCTQLGRKTVGLEVGSHGRVGLALTLNITDASIEKVNGSWAMVFTFSSSVVGTVLDWDLDQVAANRCYITKILGTEIGSICGTIHRGVMKRKEELMNRVHKLQRSPRVQAKLEKAVQAKIGSRVAVPLRVLTSAEGASGSGLPKAAEAAATRAAEALGIAGAPGDLDVASVAKKGAVAGYNLFIS